MVSKTRRSVNLFGHPTPEVLDRLRGLEIQIYRTDQDGEVQIRVNKEGGVWIDKMLK